MSEALVKLLTISELMLRLYLSTTIILWRSLSQMNFHPSLFFRSVSKVFSSGIGFSHGRVLAWYASAVGQRNVGKFSICISNRHPCIHRVTLTYKCLLERACGTASPFAQGCFYLTFHRFPPCAMVPPMLVQCFSIIRKKHPCNGFSGFLTGT